MYMKQALSLASCGLYTAYPNPAVGCVIVRDGIVIGQGYHHKAGEPHAEIMAINDANNDVAGATVYVTLEPCSHYGRTPPCAKKLIDMHVNKVVIACIDPNPKVSGKGIKMLEDAGIEVLCGLFEHKGLFLNRAFMKGITTNLPYVTLKIGMSLDAKIALKNGHSKWITSSFSRSFVQDIRARCDCIVTGVNTVIADDPKLNVRYAELPNKIKSKISKDNLRQPLKVILDSYGRLNIDDYKIFHEGKNIWVKGTFDSSLYHKTELLNEHTRCLYLPFKSIKNAKVHRIDLSSLLTYLGAKQIRNVMVEAGSTLISSFIDENLADELYVFLAPKLLGRGGKQAFMVNDVCSLENCTEFTLKKSRVLGDDLMLHYIRN